MGEEEEDKKEEKNKMMGMSNALKKGKEKSSPEMKNNTILHGLYSSTGRKEQQVVDPDRSSKQTPSMKTSGTSEQSKFAIAPL